LNVHEPAGRENVTDVCPVTTVLVCVVCPDAVAVTVLPAAEPFSSLTVTVTVPGT